MFRHIFVNRLKCLLRNRQLIFWTLLFPIVLSLFFNLAFSNIFKGTSFSSIPVAVVDNSGYSNETAFQTALESVSDDNAAATDKLFHVSVMTLDEAKNALDSGTVKGYIMFDNAAHVVVKESDTDQTVIKEFVDSYLQTASAYKTISDSKNGVSSAITYSEKDYIKNTSESNTFGDDTVSYYYALIAMAVMFGGYWGKKEVEDIQADLSNVGARINLAPVHKLKAFLYSSLASVLVEFCCLLALIAFLTLALNLNFGKQIGYVIAICFFGSIVGVAYGALIAVLVKGSVHVKSSVMIGVSMIMSCLAGLMSINVKYTVTHAVPILAYINPANLVSDALYSLYYYSSHARLYLNLGLLLGLSIIFISIVYLVLRRQKYASL